MLINRVHWWHSCKGQNTYTTTANAIQLSLNTFVNLCDPSNTDVPHWCWCDVQPNTTEWIEHIHTHTHWQIWWLESCRLLSSISFHIAPAVASWRFTGIWFPCKDLFKLRKLIYFTIAINLRSIAFQYDIGVTYMQPKLLSKLLILHPSNIWQSVSNMN